MSSETARIYVILRILYPNDMQIAKREQSYSKNVRWWSVVKCFNAIDNRIERVSEVAVYSDKTSSNAVAVYQTQCVFCARKDGNKNFNIVKFYGFPIKCFAIYELVSKSRQTFRDLSVC